MSNLFLQIEEIEGSAPILLRFTGGAMPVSDGLVYETKLNGDEFVPIGSTVATQAATSVAHAPTEMKIHLDAPWVRSFELYTEGARTPRTPEDVETLCRFLQERGRQCRVALGPIVRHGLLRSVKMEPNRAYGMDFTGTRVAPGANMDLTLTWGWASVGEIEISSQFVPPSEIAGNLATFSAALKTLMSPDALVFAFVEKLRDAVSGVLENVEKVKNLCRRVNNLVNLPGRLFHELNAAVASLARGLSSLDDLLTRTPEESYPVTGGFAARVKATRAVGEMRTEVGNGMDACVTLMDQLAKRRAREVGVRPGEPLSRIAQRELGSADRWPAIAALNEIAGQVVPPATFVIEVPGA